MSYILDALKRSEQERHQGQIPDLTAADTLFITNQRRSQAWPYILIAVLLLNAVIYGFFQWHSAWQQDDLIDEGQPRSSDANGKTKRSLQQAIEDSRPAIVVPVQSAMPANQSGVTAPKSDFSMEQDQTSFAIHPSSEPDIVRRSASQSTFVPDDNAVYIDGGLLIQPKNKRDKVPALQSESAPHTPDVVLQEQSSGTVHQQDTEPAADDINSASTDLNPYQNVPALSDLDRQIQSEVPEIKFNSHIYSDTPSARRVMINNLYLREGQSFSGLEVVEIGEIYLILDKSGVLFKIPVLKDWHGP